MTKFEDIVALNQRLNSYGYGLVINGVHDPKRNTTAHDYDVYYRLASPQEFEQRKAGQCWDYTTYEAYYFKKYFPDIKFKTWYIVFDDKDELPTHTYLTFEYNGHYYWFESSFKKWCGIWVAPTEEDIINAVMTSMHSHDMEKRNKSLLTLPYYVFTYNAITTKIYHATCVEFMKYIEDGFGNKEIPHKYNQRFNVRKISTVKESVRYMDINESVDMKLMIYDHYLLGNITESQRDELLDKLDEKILTINGGA